LEFGLWQYAATVLALAGGFFLVRQRQIAKT
jgi:hypothetical protein